MDEKSQLILARWALLGGVCWIGTSVKRGPAEFCAIVPTNSYGGCEVVECSYSSDPFESLRLAKQHLDGLERDEQT